MASWQTGDINANGIRMHYTRTGGAKPPILLAHGFSDNGLCWTRVAQALEPSYDVVMLDARGHGLSEAPEHGYGSADHAADLAGAIAALELRRPAVLGHSMGAAATLALASLYPDRVGAILLEDPPAWWVSAPAGNDAERLAQRRQRMQDQQRKTRAELIATQRAETPGWSEAELEPWAESKLQLSLNVLNPGPSSPFDWRAAMPQITCPALLIIGDTARGAIVDAEDVAALQALVPQLRVAQIADAGHSIHRDQFAPYMQAVQAFLATMQG